MHCLPPTSQDKPAKPLCRSVQAGNTVAEYALIGTGTLVLLFGAFQLLGGDLNTIFGNLDNMMKHQSQVASSATAQHLAAKNSFSPAQPSQTQTGSNPPQNGPPPSSSSGTPQGSTQQGPITQTVGANGTTETYAQNITNSAQQALADGSITQSEYNTIVALANKGHDIATVQGLLETAFTNSQGNSATYANTHLTFNGQTYTPDQLNSVLQTNVSQFGDLKQQAVVLNGVLYDQNLLTTINNSGTQIINNGFATQQQNQSSASFIQYQQTDPNTGSADTNQNSASICTAGQHLDSGNHCVP